MNVANANVRSVMPVRKTKGGYKIKNVKGKSKTKKAAKRRLRAIKASQAERKKLKSKSKGKGIYKKRYKKTNKSRRKK